jgi:putative glutamine amidotransferase
MKVGVTSGSKPPEAYESALRQVGLEPVRLAAGGQASLDSLDGLVLTGGRDVNPSRYGQARQPGTDTPDDARDELELRLIRDALERGLPMLAICRGMQMLNVARGGTLIQHLSSADVHKPKEATHHIRVAPGTHLAALIGAGEHVVNSRHHQAVDRLGDGLEVSAVWNDSVIEALEMPGQSFALAVQWHPEDRVPEDVGDRKLFEAFAAATKQAVHP